MDAINLTEPLIGREVERLFNESPAQYGENCSDLTDILDQRNGDYCIA